MLPFHHFCMQTCTTTTSSSSSMAADDYHLSPPSTTITGTSTTILISDIHHHRRPATSPPPPTKPRYELTARNISYSRPSPSAAGALGELLRRSPQANSSASFILRGVSLTARPGELLAVVGPSGAGKSTLIDVLAARTSPTSGELLLNGRRLQAPTFRRLSSHLPQHDPLLPHLTVLESLAFHSRLLNSPISAVADLLTTLRLAHVANSLISSNLSGGERRRVSIALALLADPAVILLDEPTSGLDSSSAHSVLLALRTAAEATRTVVLSIHQPSFKLLSSIDSLLLLHRGEVLHHGDLESLHSSLVASGLPVPLHLNPLEFAMEVLPHLKPISDHNPSDPSLTPTIKHLPDLDFPQKPSYPSRQTQEIRTLFSRSVKIVFRTKQLLLANTIEALVVGFLLGTIYINSGYDEQGVSKRLGLFAFTLTFLLSSTTETLPIFVGERAVLLREAAAGVYRLSSHLLAATFVFLPYLLFISFLYASSVYFLAGLCATWTAFLSFVLIVWAVLLAANSFVLFTSAVAPDYIAGTSLVTAALAGFFLFSGYFISKGSIPSYWIFFHYFSPYKYALDAMLENEYGCAAARCFGRRRSPATMLAAEELGWCEVTGKDVMESRGLKAGERWRNVVFLVGFFFVYRLVYYVVLARRSSRPKK